MARAIRTVLAAVTILATLPSFAAKGAKVSPSAVPACAERPEFLSDGRAALSGFEALPKGVLVARDAEMWIEGPDNLRLHAYQSFMRGPSQNRGEILCGSTPANLTNRFSLMAPTLIDRGVGGKVGNSLWQFQVAADRQTYSVWNKQSPSLSKARDLGVLLDDLKIPYRVYQLNRDEYRLVEEKEVRGVLQTLSIRYEIVR